MQIGAEKQNTQKHSMSWVERDPWGLNPTPGSAQDHPKIRPHVWECCPNAFWTLHDQNYSQGVKKVGYGLWDGQPTDTICETADKRSDIDLELSCFGFNLWQY